MISASNGIFADYYGLGKTARRIGVHVICELSTPISKRPSIGSRRVTALRNKESPPQAESGDKINLIFFGNLKNSVLLEAMNHPYLGHTNKSIG